MCARLLTGAKHRKGPEKDRWALHSLHSGSIHSWIPYTAAGSRGSELLKIWKILTHHGVWTTTCGLGWTWPIKIGHMATKCLFCWELKENDRLKLNNNNNRNLVLRESTGWVLSSAEVWGLEGFLEGEYLHWVLKSLNLINHIPSDHLHWSRFSKGTELVNWIYVFKGDLLGG